MSDNRIGALAGIATAFLLLVVMVVAYLEYETAVILLMLSLPVPMLSGFAYAVVRGDETEYTTGDKSKG